MTSPSCPGLIPRLKWDEAGHLRGHILAAEQLLEHAIEVAKIHGEPSSHVTPGPLRGRFATARHRIREAYEILASELKSEREPSPAEEWLLSNSHVVEEQIAEIQEDLPWGYLVELPRLASGAMRGYPRVYGLCLDYLRHTDARVDMETLASYTQAYQSVRTLSIGELWAIPIMLRLGLVLTVGALATSREGARDRARAEDWANKLIAEGQTKKAATTLLASLEKDEPPVSPALLVQLLRKLREHDSPLGAATEWVRKKAAAMNTTPEELTRLQHLRQAGDQVSVGNAITSMRTIAAFDWNAFFEQTSVVEAVLRRDPAGVYASMRDHTRDRYRHAVEDVARRCRRDDERAVATEAITLAEERHRVDPSDRRAHVGYFLVDEGRRTLEVAVGHRPRLWARTRAAILHHPKLFYFGLIGAITLSACMLAFDAGRSLSNWPALVALVALFVLPASEMAVSLLSGLVTTIVPPRVLPRMDYEKTGIPAELPTLVVVPTLIDGENTVDRLLEGLEIRSLANLDDHLRFALLTDFVDAQTEHTDEDDALLGRAKDGIAALNARHPGHDGHRYVLMHRKRVHNEAESCWMGRERKRGKIEDLNRLLRGDGGTTFVEVSAPVELLAKTKYVITLDSDTELPRSAARKLVEAMSHPLNRPVLEGNRVVKGHAVLQPRVGTYPPSCLRSRYAQLLSGPPGIDPYTTAVSDVYQDLFGEGSFVGKGIYDVDAFMRALEGRVPDNRLLSHDLFEGIFARSALASDIEVLDSQPVSYAVAAGRSHRWLRGDWQLLPWLLSPKSGLRLLDVWKIGDNLRRSLLPIAMVSLCVAGFLSNPTLALLVTSMLVVMFVLPIVARLLFGAARASGHRSRVAGTLGGDLVDNARQSFFSLVFLLDQAMLSTDAIVRTFHRLVVSKRKLLEWTTTSQAEKQLERGRGMGLRLGFGALIAAGTLVATALRTPGALPHAAPVLVVWMAAPWFAAWLSRPPPSEHPKQELTIADRQLLRRTAFATWRFFETFVTEAEHHLPPDNYQEDPRGVIANRTSPTNIGLYLMSVVSARDLGLITMREVTERLKSTLGTLELLEKREGHVLNWYDTRTAAPLEPRYVSTVDSGNLAAYLWTIRQACAELVTKPLFSLDLLRAAEDALGLVAVRPAGGEVERFAERVGEVRATLGKGALLDVGAVRKLRQSAPRMIDDPWFSRALRALDDASDEIELHPFLPSSDLGTAPDAWRDALRTQWVALEAALGGARTIDEIAALDGSVEPLCDALDAAILSVDLPELDRAEASRVATLARARAREAIDANMLLKKDLESIAARSLALADGMSFRFLFDEQRKLFAIGYNVSSARLDNSHYDLLASEARLASLVAIAKGDVPEEHWFRMGRPRALAGGGRVLLSWSGSMFEYLLPLLVTRRHENALLDETYETCVRRQIEYGAERDVPWGVSESAYNVMDLGLTYQYQAFGVPGLGLKGGLGADLVIAPYATALATLVTPREAVENLRRLADEGAVGEFGYYEAVDYTPSHVPPGRRSVVVKTFMAHHQGMTVVAFANVLGDSAMQRRFHADARIKASELMLQERRPVSGLLVDVKNAELRPTPVEPELDAVDHAGLGAASPRAHLLGHGDLATMVTSLGEGFTTWKGLDVTRFREDTSLEGGGIYVYLRDHTEKRAWSAGYLPSRALPDHYDAAFSIDRVEINRRDGDIETVTEIVVSPEHAAEVRRITLANHGSQARDLDLTTYSEIVLAARSSDVAHRAFGSMFIETEVLVDRNALIARRRPKSEGEPESWVVQVLVPEGDGWEGFEFDTSRPGFLGRGRTTSDPQGMKGPLGGEVGTVLDPAFVMRRRVRLAPGARARITLATALATSRAEAIDLVHTFATPHSVPRTFELGWADARVELKHLGITASQSHRFQRLLTAMIYTEPSLRARDLVHGDHPRGRDALWTHGISGDLPILLIRIDDPDFSDLLREVLLAQEFWRLNSMSVDLVILNEEPAGYQQPLGEGVRAVIRSSPGDAHRDQRGGVFLRRSGDLSEGDRALLLGAARVVLTASGGSLTRQLRGSHGAELPLEIPIVASTEKSALLPPLQLAFDNGIGGFSAETSEYVMTIGPNSRTPAPWSNVMANATFGSLVTESGSSFTWFGNSQRHRLTPWSNDAVGDPSGELFYLRDEDDGTTWSPTPHPAGGGTTFRVRHGQGYTSFEHSLGGLECELTTFVTTDDPVKLTRLRLTNRGQRRRQISAMNVVEWVLGGSRETERSTVVTSWDATGGVLLAHNPLGPYASRRAFLAASRRGGSHTGDRREVFGTAGTRARPAALARAALSNKTGAGLDPCGAISVPLAIEPGATVELSFILGSARDDEQASQLAGKYMATGAAEAALEQTRKAWRRVLDTVVVRTPDPALDLMLNQWLPYQVLSCRLWGRSAFYQSGGAFGFRDQLQDVLALVHARPDLVREQLLRAAAHQFVEGDVQHWWHDDSGQGVRTRCSDDMVWLPYVTAQYVRATGDLGVLDEQVAFLGERPLAPNEDDLFAVPKPAGEKASLYEHCVRALQVSATVGGHGLPLIGGGDWNDGMNRLGKAGKGESVWLAWFWAKTARDFGRLSSARGDSARVTFLETHVKQLARAVDEQAWDGEWYRRAFFDDGLPLGSHVNTECSIDAIAQSWSVISGLGDPARAKRALLASEARLVDEDAGLMRLLTPPFSGADPDPGYIRAYPPGIRENGGQYTHGASWTILALTLTGEANRAWKLYSLLNPVHHASTPEAMQRYKVEPYVITADIYDTPAHLGRGGWSWYTGSASWMYTVALEHILGIQRVAGGLRIAPCIPDEWPGFEVDYRDGDVVKHIVVKRVIGSELSITVNGKKVTGLEAEEAEARVPAGRTRAAGGGLNVGRWGDPVTGKV